ncbi:MAG TPA: hypothetical protein VM509_07765, partial [Planctomycetota bacterium]|nr:hypothetical protein [Planctomycetota bacterium]
MTRKDLRTFLGFEGGFVSAVARTLLAAHGRALASLVVVVPGRRAGRKLLEALVLQADGAIEPPRIVTEAGLARELSAREGTPASPALVEAAWLEVLASAEPAELATFQPEVAQAATWGTRVSLARQLAALDRERAELGNDADADPRSRLAALARLSARVRERLRGAGRVDPAFALEAVRDPAARRSGVQVVLAGVTELSPTLRAVLDSLVPPPRALIQATDACAAGFDAHGGIVSAYWAEREIPLRDEDWLPVDDPAAAIRAALAWIQRLPAGTATDEIAFGLPAAALLPGLAHACAERGLTLHAAAGTATKTSAPWLALDALHAWIAREDFSALASALRHPDVERHARAAASLSEGPACSALLDAWHAEHLPDALRGALPGEDEASASVRRLRDAVRTLCSELARADERPLTAWTAPIVELVCRLFPAVGGEASPAERATRQGLERFAELAHDLGGLPPDFSALPLRGEQALRLWLDWTADDALRDAPAANAVEALGWLELSMEDAPWLLLVGLNDGWVPENPRSHPLLGKESEAAQGEQARTRLARDVHALTAIALHRSGAPRR